MDAVERRDGVLQPERPRTEAERRTDIRSSRRAEALRANLGRRKFQIRARAEALRDLPPDDTGAVRSPD